MGADCAGRDLGVKDGKGAAVTVEQRAGDGARLHWYLHLIIADGVFHPENADDAGPLAFQRVSAPTKEELAALLVHFKKRCYACYAARVSRLKTPDDTDPDTLAEGAAGPLLFAWQAAMERKWHVSM